MSTRLIRHGSNGKTRTEDTVRRLRSEILGGTLEPGTQLAEAAVAGKLGVSRVPVREALFTLEREGLVEFSATGRAYVKELAPHDFEELFLLRLSLEPMAARLAATQLRENGRDLERNIEATARARTLKEVTKLDLDFHGMILEVSGHQRLARLWQSLRAELELWLSRLHRSHQAQTRGTREETVEAHRKLLACMRNQPPAAVERLMRQHILGWREWLPMPEATNLEG
jgi:DNA-binding GntR family transcriptional regulator